MDENQLRELGNQWLARTGGEYVIYGESRRLRAGRVIFETALADGSKGFMGFWIVIDPRANMIWATAYGGLEFLENIGLRAWFYRALFRARCYRSWGTRRFVLVPARTEIGRED